MTPLRVAGLFALLGVGLVLVGFSGDPLWPPQDFDSALPHVVQDYYARAHQAAWFYRGGGAAFLAAAGAVVVAIVRSRSRRRRTGRSA